MVSYVRKCFPNLEDQWSSKINFLQNILLIQCNLETVTWLLELGRSYFCDLILNLGCVISSIYLFSLRDYWSNIFKEYFEYINC